MLKPGVRIDSDLLVHLISTEVGGISSIAQHMRISFILCLSDIGYCVPSVLFALDHEIMLTARTHISISSVSYFVAIKVFFSY